MTSVSGHRSVAHTADTIIEAWAPDLGRCLAEACHGLLAEFCEVPTGAPVEHRPFDIAAPDAGRLLAALLEEVIFVIDAEGRVPSRVAIAEATERRCRGTMQVVPLEVATQIGSVPKSIALSGIHMAPTDTGWSCHVVVDV